MKEINNTDFQSKFYERVAEKLPEFYNAISTLQIVDDVALPNDYNVILFGFTEVTGKYRREEIFVEKSENVDDAVDMLRAALLEDYPAFVHFDTLKEAIDAAKCVGDSDSDFHFNYGGVLIKVQGNPGTSICVWSEDNGFENTWDFDVPSEKIAEDVMLDVFGIL